MFTVKDLKDNVINLDGLKEYNIDFEVLSLKESGKRIPFRVDLISTESIKIRLFGVSSINIVIDVENILKDEYIVLKNTNNEKIIITVKPNEYYVNDRDYRFKITREEKTKDGDIRIRLMSKVNKSEIGWRCTYDGRPISYEITPMESNKSEYIKIKLKSKMLTEYNSVIIFQQEESGETVELKIKNTTDGMEIIKG